MWPLALLWQAWQASQTPSSWMTIVFLTERMVCSNS